MKYVKKIFTLFMCSTVLLSLAGCAEKNTDLEKKGQTVKTTISSNTFAQKYIAPTEDGYYIIDDGILSFIDIKSEKEIPVCNKPDCKHKRNENCNAEMDYDIEFQTDQNALYMQKREENGNVDFYKVSMDASEQERLFTLANVQGEREYEYSIPYALADGYVYYVFNNLDGEKEKNTTLCRRALKKNAKEEEIYSEKGYAVSFDDFQVYHHQIYFDVDGFKKRNEEGEILKLCKYDIDAKKEETVWNNGYGWYVKMGDLIYRPDENGKLMCFSEKTGKTTEIKTEENMFDVDLRTDGEYLYLFHYKEHMLRIIDTSGKQLALLKDMPSYMVGADKNILFFQGDGDQFYGMYDRNEALKGNMKKIWSKK